MSITESGRIGKRGTFVIPANLRRRFGLSEGTTVIAEETEEGILLRPAVTVPVDSYSSERRAEFLLSNAVDDDDYARAREAVQAMGIDPDSIDHHRR
jgi:AbrB family looped-hinge helix DNA binding protein